MRLCAPPVLCKFLPLYVPPLHLFLPSPPPTRPHHYINQAGGKPFPLLDINPATTTILDMVGQAQAQASTPIADKHQVVTVTLSSSSEAQQGPDPTKPAITELDQADEGGEHKGNAAEMVGGVVSVLVEQLVRAVSDFPPLLVCVTSHMILKRV